MTMSDVETEVLQILLMGSETTELLSTMFVDEHEAALRRLGDGDLRVGLGRTLEGLEAGGLLTAPGGWWQLTDAGRETARKTELA